MIKLVINLLCKLYLIIKYKYKELGKINIFACLSKTCLIENNFKSICPMNKLNGCSITDSTKVA